MKSTPASKVLKSKPVKSTPTSKVSKSKPEKSIPTSKVSKSKPEKSEVVTKGKIVPSDGKNQGGKKVAIAGTKRGKAASGPKKGAKKSKTDANISSTEPEVACDFTTDYLASTTSTLFKVSLLCYFHCRLTISNDFFQFISNIAGHLNIPGLDEEVSKAQKQHSEFLQKNGFGFYLDPDAAGQAHNVSLGVGLEDKILELMARHFKTYEQMVQFMWSKGVAELRVGQKLITIKRAEVRDEDPITTVSFLDSTGEFATIDTVPVSVPTGTYILGYIKDMQDYRFFRIG